MRLPPPPAPQAAPPGLGAPSPLPRYDPETASQSWEAGPPQRFRPPSPPLPGQPHRRHSVTSCQGACGICHSASIRVGVESSQGSQDSDLSLRVWGEARTPTITSFYACCDLISCSTESLLTWLHFLRATCQETTLLAPLWTPFIASSFLVRNSSRPTIRGGESNLDHASGRF